METETRPGETACEGCIHGEDCRVLLCEDCDRKWHVLGHGSSKFSCCGGEG